MTSRKKYAGQHVAWSLDGKQILAGDTDFLHLTARLEEAGYDSEQFILSFVDDGRSYIGGVALADDNWEQDTSGFKHFCSFQRTH